MITLPRLPFAPERRVVWRESLCLGELVLFSRHSGAYSGAKAFVLVKRPSFRAIFRAILARRSESPAGGGDVNGTNVRIRGEELNAGEMSRAAGLSRGQTGLATDLTTDCHEADSYPVRPASSRQRP